MTRLEVVDVTREDAGDALVAHGLDAPEAGSSSVSYGLDIRGWAVGHESPARSVAVWQHPIFLRRAQVDGYRPDVVARHPNAERSGASGFFVPIGALRLAQEFQVEVRLELADGTPVPLTLISGRRAPLRATFEPEIAAIGLTALGRTGSTAVTSLLGSHPQIVAYRPFEYEPRVTTCWIETLRDLADPAAFRRQVSPSGPLTDNWWVAARPPFPRRIKDETIQAWVGGESIDHLADFCLARIDGFYTRVAEEFERPDARFFVEKLGLETGALLREIHPRAREIFLVRDFRDVLASTFAYNAKRGVQGFGRARFENDVDYVRQWFAVSVREFVHAWRSRAGGAHLIRYEDLIRAPRKTLEATLAYLELDTPSATLDGMLASIQAREFDVHRTSDEAASIGRWRRDLSDDVCTTCERALGNELREFGYEV